MPMALARCSSGHVSATSAPPGGPFSANPQPQQKTKDSELDDRMRQAATGCEDGVDQHADDEGAGPSQLVGQPPKEDAADGRRDQGESHEKACGCRAHVEIALQIDQDQRKQHHVHAVEHPAQRCGEKGAFLCGGCPDQPLRTPHLAPITKYFAAFEILFLSSRVLVHKEKFRKHSSEGGTLIFSDVVFMRKANVSSDLFRRVLYVHYRQKESFRWQHGRLLSISRSCRPQASRRQTHPSQRNQRKGL